MFYYLHFEEKKSWISKEYVLEISFSIIKHSEIICTLDQIGIEIKTNKRKNLKCLFEQSCLFAFHSHSDVFIHIIEWHKANKKNSLLFRYLMMFVNASRNVVVVFTLDVNVRKDVTWRWPRCVHSVRAGLCISYERTQTMIKHRLGPHL